MSPSELQVKINNPVDQTDRQKGRNDASSSRGTIHTMMSSHVVFNDTL